MLRALLDWLLTRLAHVVLRAFYRTVEIQGLERLPPGRPVLVVANHFNGFVDPVMLIRVFGRLPRFLAKSTLWDARSMRPFLALAGIIPVYRTSDRADVSGNQRTFAVAERVLRAGGLVGVFPEGDTHDDPVVKRLRTGAARIALGAHAEGAKDALVVAVGLTFDDKIALRSRVLARIAEPIDLDAVVATLADADGQAPIDETNRPAVRQLTTLITQRLVSVAPNYRNMREAKVLGVAAEIALRPQRSDRSGRVELADRETLAQRLAAAPAPRLRTLTDAVARYHLDLAIAGLQDRQVVSDVGVRQLLAQTVTSTLVLALLAPFALVGAVWNALPYAVVFAAGHAANQPVTKGTARLLTSLVAFPLAWTAVALLDRWEGVLPTLAVFALAPALGLIAVASVERASGVIAAWRAWVGLTDRRALLDGVLHARQQVLAAVEHTLADEALAQSGDTGDTADAR